MAPRPPECHRIAGPSESCSDGGTRFNESRREGLCKAPDSAACQALSSPWYSTKSGESIICWRAMRSAREKVTGEVFTGGTLQPFADYPGAFLHPSAAFPAPARAAVWETSEAAGANGPAFKAQPPGLTPDRLVYLSSGPGLLLWRRQSVAGCSSHPQAPGHGGFACTTRRCQTHSGRESR